MKIAGIGFRGSATVASVLDALDRAGANGVRSLALPARRTSHPLAATLAAQGFDLTWVPDDALAATATLTRSPVAQRHYATGSLAEAAALAAARVLHPDARLAGPRAISHDRLASAALALTPEVP